MKGKYKIVIVENDPDERLFMKEGFHTADLFDVMAELSNGDELFEWLNANENNLPQVILTDLNMHGKNGYDILTTVMESPQWRHILVVITSTSNNKSTIERCLSLGATEYLVKPETFVDYVPYVQNLHNKIQQRLVNN